MKTFFLSLLIVLCASIGSARGPCPGGRCAVPQGGSRYVERLCGPFGCHEVHFNVRGDCGCTQGGQCSCPAGRCACRRVEKRVYIRAALPRLYRLTHPATW